MAIPLQRVARVVIRGEWYSVQLSTFEVLEMAFSETGSDDDVKHHPVEGLAYHFVTPNNDEYWGPLSALEIIKLLEL